MVLYSFLLARFRALARALRAVAGAAEQCRAPALAFFLVTTVIALLPQGSARAEDDPPAAERPLETVTVTATRRPTAIGEVAAAVTTVKRETLRPLAPDVFAEALRGTPGAFFQQTTPGQGIPIVRGLKGSQVLHLVDGIRVNNAFFRDAPNQYLGLVDPFTVERVEVLRGAAGSLYGADAMGGVVQVFTREALFEGPARDAGYRLFGSFDSADRGWAGRAAAAVGNARTSLAGGVSWQDRDDRRTGDGETVTPSGFTSRAGNLRWRRKTESGHEWMLSVQSLEQPATPRVDELVPGFGQERPAASEYAFEPNRRTLLHGRYRYPGGDRLDGFELHLARQVITDDRVIRAFESPERVRERNESTLDGFTLQAFQALTPGLSLLWGSELYRDTVRSARQVTNLDSGAVAPAPPRFPDRSTLDSDSVFANLGWKGTGPWSADAGLRFSRFRIRLPTATGAPATTRDLDDVTGDLRLRYRLREGVSLITNLGRGFRPPNVFDLGTLGPRPGNRFNVANPELGPETVWSYDLGIKTVSGAWALEGFLFHLDYRDRITSVATGERTPDGRVVVRSENRDTVRISGLETALSWTPSPALEGRLVVNFAYGDERDDTGRSVPADRIPPLNGRLALTWRPSSRWRLDPFLLFAARQDRLSPRDERDPRIDPRGTAGWVTLNVHARWQARPDLALGLRLENLLDEAYREHGSGLDAPGFNLGLWVDATF